MCRLLLKWVDGKMEKYEITEDKSKVDNVKTGAKCFGLGCIESAMDYGFILSTLLIIGGIGTIIVDVVKKIRA